MRKFDLVAVDIDGTLLNSQHRLTENTKRVVQLAVEKGIVLTLSTGRMYQSACAIAAEMGLDVPLITYNGALVKNSISKDVFFQKKISMDISIQTMDRIERAGIHYQVYTEDALYVPKMTEKSRVYAARTGVSIHPLTELNLDQCSGFYKFLVMGDTRELDDLMISMEAALGGQVRSFKSHPLYLEIVHAEVSKGNALRQLASSLNIGHSRIMAIGDQYNDLDMITFAGLGVAMGNAPDDVKSFAGYVTGTNDEEGAAAAIQHWALS